jgi:hypothetical protein
MSCAVKCDVTSQKIELKWLQSFKKRNNYGDGGGWEAVVCQDQQD